MNQPTFRRVSFCMSVVIAAAASFLPGCSTSLKSSSQSELEASQTQSDAFWKQYTHDQEIRDRAREQADKERQENMRRQEMEWIAAREAAGAARTNYVVSNPHLRQEISKAILEKRVAIGMTSEQVVLSWGKPKSVTSTTTSSTQTESWYYSNRDAILRFADGKLASFTATTAPQ